MSDKLIHEIRSPLTVVIGFLDLLERHWDDFDDDVRREFIRACLKQANALADLMPAVDEALAMSPEEVIDLSVENSAQR